MGSDFDFITSLREDTPTYRSSLPLVGIDGNAFSIIATVVRGLKRAGAPPEYVADVQQQMMSGDYDHLLQVAIMYTEA